MKNKPTNSQEGKRGIKFRAFGRFLEGSYPFGGNFYEDIYLIHKPPIEVATYFSENLSFPTESTTKKAVFRWHGDEYIDKKKNRYLVYEFIGFE